MATYVALCNFTDQGIRNIKDTVHRAEAVQAAARQFGVEMTSIVWTQGHYDLICTFDAQDEKAITAFGLAIAMQGNVRTQTLRAYSRSEMQGILAKLG